jgi:hypothetical protein
MLLTWLWEVAWVQIWSLGALVVAVVWAYRGRIEVEIEGEQPFATITGRLVFIVASLVAVLAVTLLLFPEIVVEK